ncbi:uncharacterized protein LOC143082016 [Mytilus galloprovincialis]|uniref:Uncharacterized protein n=1 Tax=Mytilus galloprovincialis TaxID=29158 RepID=A0A8B6BS33_MYTGA|nr:Hypothetical predicted protein [Mytilus galloprovincialis]
MHTKMFLYLMFFIFEISAGATEFPCKFPSPWRNKLFKLYTSGFNPDFIFSADGLTNNITFHGSLVVQQQCYQITERFIIARNYVTHNYQCYVIFYDIENPLKFTFETKALVQYPNQSGEFEDICTVCGGDGGISEAVASGAVQTSPSVTSVPCNLPSTCTSGTGTLCAMSDIIPGSAVATTESPTSKTEQISTVTEATTTRTEPTTTITEPTTTLTESTTTKEPTKPTRRHCRWKKHPHTK